MVWGGGWSEYGFHQEWWCEHRVRIYDSYGSPRSVEEMID